MDSANAIALSMFTGYYVEYSTLFIFFLFSFPSSSVQYQITVPIIFEIIYFPLISDTPLEMMGYILSVNMYYSEKICTLVDLSTMHFDPSESNLTFS